MAELTISNQISSVLEGTHAASSIFSPETGIIDPYEYCKSLMQSAEDAGVSVITHAQVTGVERRTDGYLLHTTRGEVLAETVINSAGLQADEIARMVGIKTYTLYPCRGDYFRFRSPIQYTQLIYPVKQKNNPGLGVHLTLSLDGSQRLGPDAYYVDSKEDFSDPSPIDEKKQIFFEAAKKIFKNIDLSMLSCDSCGIRPKLRAPNGSKELDFVISKDLDGWINLMGIESPGLTAARAVARKVAGML